MITDEGRRLVADAIRYDRREALALMERVMFYRLLYLDFKRRSGDAERTEEERKGLRLRAREMLGEVRSHLHMARWLRERAERWEAGLKEQDDNRAASG